MELMIAEEEQPTMNNAKQLLGKRDIADEPTEEIGELDSRFQSQTDEMKYTLKLRVARLSSFETQDSRSGRWGNR